MKQFYGLVFLLMLFMLVGGVGGTAKQATSSPEPIGLSLFFHNGQSAPISR
jgi:hypothetical protein